MTPFGSKANADSDLLQLRRAAEVAAHAGGAVVAERFRLPERDGRPTEFRTKGRGDYISETDVMSEETIREALAVSAPGIPFFGEELGGEHGERSEQHSERSEQSQRGEMGSVGWIVDPLDGTTNFLHGFPVVGVSVALVEDGRPLVGVVHAPLLGETYSAHLGGGTHRWNGSPGGGVGGTPVRVSGRPAAQAVCATGFPFKSRDRMGEHGRAMRAILDHVEDLRRPGAASLDLAWTAAGIFEGFFELGLGPWDVAAGALLVTEAGGVVTDWHGDDRRWLATGDILAGSPEVHATLLDLIRATREGTDP